MQPVELAGATAASTETAELLERVAVQHVNRHVRVVTDVEAALLRISGEAHRYRRTRQPIRFHSHLLFFNEAAFTRLTGAVRAFLAEIRIAAVENLNAVVAAVADVKNAFLADLHAVHRIAEKRRLHVAFGEVVHPRTGGSGGLVVHGVVAIRAEMADVLATGGVQNDDSAVAVAVGDVHAIGGRIDREIGRQKEQRRSVLTAVLIVAVGALGWTAKHHHEFSVFRELQDHSVGAAVVRGPRGRRRLASAAVAADINEAVVVDEDPVFARRPEATLVGPTLVGIAWSSPRAQQLTV